MSRPALSIFASFCIIFFPTTAEAEPNWKQTVQQLVTCAQKQDIECALDLAEETALSLRAGKPYSSGSLAPVGPRLLSDVIAQRVSRGQIKHAEILYELALQERMQEGFNSDRPVNMAQDWLAAGYLREGSISQLSYIIENSFGFDGKIVTPASHAQQFRRAIQFMNDSQQKFDETLVANTILQWIAQQDEKQQAAEQVAIFFISEGNYEAADIILSHYASEGAQTRLDNNRKWQEKSETIASLLKNSETSQIITLLKQDRLSEKIAMSSHVAHRIKRLTKLYSETDRTELIPPLLLLAGAYGSDITEKTCKSAFTKRMIHLALNYQNKQTFERLSKTLNLDAAAVDGTERCPQTSIKMRQADIDLAYAIYGDKAAEERFFTAKQYSTSRDHFISQYRTITDLFLDAPQLPPALIRSFYERASLLKTDLKKFDYAYDIARDARNLVRAGYNAEALAMLKDLLSRPEISSFNESEVKRLAMTALFSMFHWRNFI